MSRSYREVIYFVAIGVMLCGLAFVPSSHVVRSGAPPTAVRPGAATSVTAPLAGGFGSALGAEPQQQQDQEEVVEESGDPDAPPETLTINEAAVMEGLREGRALSAFPARQRQLKDERRVAEAMLAHAERIASHQPPISRKNNPRQIRRIIGLYDEALSAPYCAMGIAYVASMAYCGLPPARITYSERNEVRTFKNVLPLIQKYYFTPSKSCKHMMKEAKKKGSSRPGGWVAKGTKQPRRAWLVLFDWNGDGVPQHVGLVKSVSRDGRTLSTVEFNTCLGTGKRKRCGLVAEKVRPMREVIGFIRTY